MAVVKRHPTDALELSVMLSAVGMLTYLEGYRIDLGLWSCH